MREKLSRRLVHLEEIHAAVRRKAACASAADSSSLDILCERLKARGFVQTGNESFAEMMARAFVMSPRALRAYLQ